MRGQGVEGVRVVVRGTRERGIAYSVIPEHLQCPGTEDLKLKHSNSPQTGLRGQTQAPRGPSA